MDEAEAIIVIDDTPGDTAVDSFLPSMAECEFKTLPDGWKKLPTDKKHKKNNPDAPNF